MSFRATETDGRREPRHEGVRTVFGYLVEVAPDSYRPTADPLIATHVHAYDVGRGGIVVAPIGTDEGGVRTYRLGTDRYVIYAGAPPPAPTWPEVDADLEVFPGDDLAAAVNGAPAGSDIYVHHNLDGTPYTYELGTSELAPADGVTIRAAAPATTVRDTTRQVYGITPYVIIRTDGYRIFADAGSADLFGLWLRDAKYDGSDQTTGRAIHRGSGSVRYCRLSHNENNAIGGTYTGLVEYCEVDYNSSADISGISAAIKTTDPITIRHCWGHHNYKHFAWQDCEGTGFVVTDNVIEDNVGTGLFNEISKGLSLLARNLIRNNNTGMTAGRGGIIVTSSKNVTIEDNVLDGNGVQNLRIWEDSRFQNGDASCTSGYYLEGVLVSGNQFIGMTPRLLFNGGSTINVLADATYPNPHGSAPVGASVAFAENSY